MCVLSDWLTADSDICVYVYDIMDDSDTSAMWDNWPTGNLHTKLLFDCFTRLIRTLKQAVRMHQNAPLPNKKKSKNFLGRGHSHVHVSSTIKRYLRFMRWSALHRWSQKLQSWWNYHVCRTQDATHLHWRWFHLITLHILGDCFLPRDSIHKRGLCRRAVSQCLSATFVYCIKTSNHILKLFSVG